MIEHVKNSALPKALADVVGDLAELFQKEVRLAKAELSEKLAAKLRAGVWMAVAGGLGLLAVLLVIQGIVFGIATLGIPLHWSCLIVAAVTAVAGALVYAKAMADLRQGSSPTRTMNQVAQDIAVVKEQLT